jgi:uncharacterized protein YpmB
MNEIFEFHKTLNKKKIAIFITVIIIVLLLILFIIEHYNENFKKFEESSALSVTFIDKNNELSIELSKKYNLSLTNIQESNHVLDLSSPDELYISISKEDLISNRSLADVVESDKKVFTQNFSNVSNTSEISEVTTNNMQSCTYNFNYTNSESNKTYYLQTLWIQTESNYYIIDVSFIQNDSQNYNNILNDIVSNFKIMN